MADFTLDKATRTLALGTTDCLCVSGPCGTGLVAGRKACVKCNGTGNGPRGGKRGCRDCHGFATKPDFENPVTCGSCDGDGVVDTTYCDRLDNETAHAVADMLAWHVARSGRVQSWNEAHLGLGCLYSVTDYGAHGSITDDDLIAKVREHFVTGYTQAINVVDRETGALATDIVIDCNANGYSARAYFGEVRRMANVTDYRDDGMAVYAAGGNGTMAAAVLDNASTVPMGDAS